jgi:thioredoxin-related protein
MNKWKERSGSMSKLIVIGSETCTQCRALKKELQFVPHEESNEYDKYDVMSVPTLILLDDDGKEIKRMTGFHSAKQIAEWELA